MLNHHLLLIVIAIWIDAVQSLDFLGRPASRKSVLAYAQMKTVIIRRCGVKFDPETYPTSEEVDTFTSKKAQVGKDQEKAQSEKDSHSKNRGGKKQTDNQVLIP